MILCLCGCGEEVKLGNRYIQYHHLKRKYLSGEHRKKISKGLEGNQNLLGHRHSEETKRKIGEALKGKKHWLGKKHSKESKEKMSEAKKGKVFSEEAKKKMSESKKGHPVSKETRDKLSIANKGQVPSAKCGRGKRSFYNNIYQGKICFRSSYEKAYAQWLDSGRKDWLYEPVTFNLGNTTYTPDFYLIKSGRFIEIKGYMSKKAQNKIDAFKKIYPNEWLEVLFREDLIEMGVLL